MITPGERLTIWRGERCPMVHLRHGTRRRIESESSQAEACECDRDLRAVVLRNGP